VFPCVATQPALSLKRLLFRNTLKYLVYSALCIWLTVATWFTQSVHIDSFPSLLVLGGLAGLLGLAFAGPKLLRAAFLWLRCLPVDGSLRQIGLAVRDAMVRCDLIQTSRRGWQFALLTSARVSSRFPRGRNISGRQERLLSWLA